MNFFGPARTEFLFERSTAELQPGAAGMEAKSVGGRQPQHGGRCFDELYEIILAVIALYGSSCTVSTCRHRKHPWFTLGFEYKVKEIP
jgi:hypothetical protein